MKSIAFFMIFSMFSSNAFSSEKMSKEDEAKLEAKAVMGGIYETFVKIIPYVYSQDESLMNLNKDPVKKKELLKNLEDLSAFFKGARHVEYFQRPGFRPSLDTMNGYLNDTINSVQSNNYIFAQKRLSTLTSLCITCHSQLSNKGAENAFSAQINKTTREKFDNDFSYGNYLFLIRNFPEAEKYLRLAFENSLKGGSANQLYPSMRRLISIHTKITFDYVKAKELTTWLLSHSGIPKLAKDTILSWDKGLTKWKDFQLDKNTDVEKFINTHLAPLEEIKEITGDGDNDISLLVASGVLSKYLNDNPKSNITPKILYWLSVAERRLSNTYYFIMSDLYLKECVKKYPESPFAKKCYNLYESNIQESFMGSGGLDIPPDEKLELTKLRGLLK